MELKLLRAFVCVADTGHFGRAASTLCITQPALSKQIAALETSLGARLLHRGRLGATLTPFGRAFVQDARRLVTDVDEVVVRARQASRGERGSLSVGFGLSTLDLAPAYIERFRAKYPHVEVVLNDMPSAVQTRKLLAGQLDIGFTRLPVPTGLDSLPLLNESLALVVPINSHFQTLPRSLDELNVAGFVLLARLRGPGLAEQIDHWCAVNCFVPRCTQRADDVQTVLAVVAAGLGAALLPMGSANVRSQGVCFIPIQHAAAQWQVGLTWRQKMQNAVVERFVEMVRAELPT